MYNTVETVDISIPSFFEFISKDSSNVVFKDNPVFTSRLRYKDGNIKYKSMYGYMIEGIKRELGDQFDNNKLNYLNNKLSSPDSSLIYSCQNDRILGIPVLYDTLVEKIGYVSYAKEYITWYDLSSMLPELLSLLTGTNTDIIRLFMDECASKKGLTLSDYSRSYLSNRYVPADYMLDLLNCICPTVTNLIESLMNKGHANQFLIRGRNVMHENYFLNHNGQWILTDSLLHSLSYQETLELYVCYCFRLLEYYLFKCIYDIINSKYNSMWTEYNATKRSLSELLVGWSLSDIVFQNGKQREFPVFIFKGRCGFEVEVKPMTMSPREVLVGFFNGDIYL